MPCAYCFRWVDANAVITWEWAGHWKGYHRHCHKALGFNRSMKRLNAILDALEERNPAAEPQIEQEFLLMERKIEDLTRRVDLVCERIIMGYTSERT